MYMRPPLTDEDFKLGKQTMPRGAIYYGWFYFKEENFSLGISLKCGTASIKQFVWMNEQADNITSIEPRQVTDDAYFVVRHPLDRFCSLWKNKCRDNGSSRYKKLFADMSPVDLMDFIDSGVKEIHLEQQNTLLNKGNQSAKLIPLEMLEYWWKQSGLGELGRFNTSEGDVDIDDELKERILTYYADDLTLYHKAQCDFCWATVIPNLHV